MYSVNISLSQTLDRTRSSNKPWVVRGSRLVEKQELTVLAQVLGVLHETADGVLQPHLLQLGPQILGRRSSNRHGNCSHDVGLLFELLQSVGLSANGVEEVWDVISGPLLDPIFRGGCGWFLKREEHATGLFLNSK